MAMPRPLVAGVDTSVMMAVDRDTFPVKRIKKINISFLIWIRIKLGQRIRVWLRVGQNGPEEKENIK